jgi:hypothetical protein
MTRPRSGKHHRLTRPRRRDTLVALLRDLVQGFIGAPTLS